VLNGANAGLGAVGLTIAATSGPSVIRGLMIRDFNSDGVHIVDSANNIIGGSTAPSNVISGNHGEGLRIDGALATGNVIADNYIGTDTSGAVALANLNSGVYIRRAPANSVLRNVISGNTGFAGVAICGNQIVCGNADVGTQGNN